MSFRWLVEGMEMKNLLVLLFFLILIPWDRKGVWFYILVLKAGNFNFLIRPGKIYLSGAPQKGYFVVRAFHLLHFLSTQLPLI